MIKQNERIIRQNDETAIQNRAGTYFELRLMDRQIDKGG
jgi:hypothetical protein